MQPGAPLVAIAGPTAVGKTALAVALAQRLRVEIVSVDSRQVYRGMDIGTGKPTVRQRAMVRHHLLDVVDPDQEFGLASYLELTRATLEGIHQRGALPLVVGGTGQYLWALLEAWRVPAVPPDRELRRRLEQEAADTGDAALHRRLASVDPESAARIDPRNVRRVVRALEVFHQTGTPLSALTSRGPSPFRSLVLGLTLPRPQLYARIDRRIEAMVDGGWLQEVDGLLARGYSLDLSALSSVGYREMAGYLRGQTSLEQAIQATKNATHRFARHQYAWFRLRDPRVRWLAATRGVQGRAWALVARFLEEAGAPYDRIGSG